MICYVCSVLFKTQFLITPCSPLCSPHCADPLSSLSLILHAHPIIGTRAHPYPSSVLRVHPSRDYVVLTHFNPSQGLRAHQSQGEEQLVVLRSRCWWCQAVREEPKYSRADHPSLLLFVTFLITQLHTFHLCFVLAPPEHSDLTPARYSVLSTSQVLCSNPFPPLPGLGYFAISHKDDLSLNLFYIVDNDICTYKITSAPRGIQVRF